jgi:hypothetical protein
MTPEDILAHDPIVLNQDQRKRYFSEGFLAIPGAIPMDWVERLNQLSDQFLDASRRFSTSDNVFDIGPNHCPETPHVRRLKALVAHAPRGDYAPKRPQPKVIAEPMEVPGPG